MLVLDVQGNRLELPIGLDGVFRVSSAGLPGDVAIWRPVPDVPLALKGTWRRDNFVITARDLLGTLDGEISLHFGETFSVRIQALGLPNSLISGAPQ